VADVLGGVKARLRTMRHRGSAPWLVEPIANLYARGQWARQRWQLRSYDRSSWLGGRDDIGAVVEFAFDGYGGAFAPLQSRFELEALARLVRSRSPEVVLELGTARGGTFFVLAQMAADGATLLSVDLPCGIGGSGYPAWKNPILASFATRGQQVHLIRADSHRGSTVDEVRRILGDRPIDLLFIDADHSYDGVRTDYELYAPLVASDGILCLHDVVPNPYNDAIEVDRFWTEVAGEQATVIRDPGGIAGYGIGVLESLTPAS
jgi:predicted O-methyltransferase YrrM